MADISAIKLPSGITYDIKDSGAARGNARIFYGTCATIADTAEKAVVCPEFTAEDLVPGTVINVLFSVTNSAAVASLQLNVNETGAKNIKYIYNGSYSNIPGVGYIKLNQIYQFTYDGTYWVVQMIYNTNTDITYNLYYSTPKAGPGGIFPYTLILPLPDGRYSSTVTSSSTGTSKSRNTNGFLPGMVFYYPINRTLAEDATNANDYLRESSSLIDLRYSGNKGTTLVAKKSVYLVGSIGTDGLFYLDSDWLSQDIPTSENEKVYLFLGESYDTYRIDLDAYNPMFKYVNGAFRQISIDSLTTNGHTVNADVPANAKFTDTVTTATTSGSGNAVTAISASNGALTVTKGSTFLLTSDISSWAKASSKPSYTFSEIGSKPTTISGYGITDAYTKTEVDNKVSAVLRYKGVKAAVSNLPTSGNVTGDVWHVTATSGEYAWDGTEWQELGTAISIPANTGSSTTGISIAAHGTGTVTGVQSTTTTASKVTVGSSSTDYGVKSAGSASTWTFEEKTIPNVTAVGSASTWTFEEKTIPNVTSAGTASSWTFEEKTIPNVTAAGSGSASLTFTMDTTDTKKLKIAFSHTHTAPTIGTAIKVQSKSGGSNGTAPTLGTAIKVQSKSGGANGTAPTLGTAIKVQSKSGGANSTAPTLGSKVPTVSASDVTVPIKNTSASTFVTGTTHTITDNGHTHTI